MTRRAPISLDNFARTLLATTCLAAVSGTAVAGTITEGTPPAPADFPDTANGYLLPIGTTQVQGAVGFNPVNVPEDPHDWFEFQGLLAGGSYSLTYTSTGQETQVRLFTDGGEFITSQSLNVEFGHTAILGGVIPGDGKLVVDARLISGVTDPYTVSLSAPLAAGVPEPSTLMGTGLALAGALAWRRKRKQ